VRPPRNVVAADGLAPFGRSRSTPRASRSYHRVVPIYPAGSRRNDYASAHDASAAATCAGGERRPAMIDDPATIDLGPLGRAVIRQAVIDARAGSVPAQAWLLRDNAGLAFWSSACGCDTEMVRNIARRALSRPAPRWLPRCSYSAPSSPRFNKFRRGP
jgi:hypothetical protein